MRALPRAAAPVLGAVLALALLAQTRGLDAIARGDQLGPGFWPRLVLAGLMLACLAEAVRSARVRGAAAAATSTAGTGEELGEISRVALAAAVALIVLYVLATPLVGFPLATAAFIVAFMRLAGARSIPAITLTAAAGTVALLYLFVKVVYLPLPKGGGPFEAVTLGLYRALRIF